MFAKVVSVANWVFLSFFGLLALLFIFGSDSGGGALAGFATVIALTGIIWVPVAALTSIVGVVGAYRKHESIKKLFKAPALYVLFVVVYLLMVMFG